MTNAQISDCLNSPPGRKLHSAITTGLQEMMDGDPHRGALTMLRHEQQDTLQKAVYDSSFNSFGLRLNEAMGAALTRERLVFSERCAPSGQDRAIA